MNPTNHHDTRLRNLTCLCDWCFITLKWTARLKSPLIDNFFKRVGRVLSSEHILDWQGAEGPVHVVEYRNDYILPWIITIIINTVFRKEKGAAESMSCILKCLSNLSSFWYLTFFFLMTYDHLFHVKWTIWNRNFNSYISLLLLDKMKMPVCWSAEY